MNVDRPARRIRLPFQKRDAVLPNEDATFVSRRVPMLHFLPLTAKNHLVAMMGEFVGTFLFLLFALGGTNVVNAAPQQGQPINLAANPAKLMFIALCFGFSLAVNAWVFFRITGGLFNPAVSLGMMVVGAVPYFRGCLIIISQILGGIVASGIVSCLLPGPLNVQTTLGGGTTVVQGLFIEMFLTAQLVFTIFMLAAEKHRATFIAPVGIGLSLFIAELMGVYYTGGSLNPARSFGPCVILGSFTSYHWIYWLGPTMGSLLASGFYMFIKALEYETVNPEQDASGSVDGDSGVRVVFDPEMDKALSQEKENRIDANDLRNGVRGAGMMGGHGDGVNGRATTSDSEERTLGRQSQSRAADRGMDPDLEAGPAYPGP